jgi:hypothetical protein
MNIHQKDYVPKFLDLGNVALNMHEFKHLTLRNIITASFEYEFVPIKVSDNITLDSVVGVIEPLSNKTITFKFKPTSCGTFMAEYEFRLSEFDFKPVVISVSGTCNVYNIPNNTNMIKHMKQFKEDPNKSGNENIKAMNKTGNDLDINNSLMVTERISMVEEEAEEEVMKYLII